jgi:O-antigen/teichoic acid export membrane protein
VTPSTNYIRNLATTVGGQAAILGLGVFTGIASARLLGPQGRGELAAVTLWPLMLVLLASFGMGQAVVFHAGKQRFALSEIWTAALAIGLVQAVVVLLLGWMALPLAFRHEPAEARHLATVLLCCSPLFIFAGYPACVLQGKLQLAWFNMIRAAAPAVYAAGLAVLLWRRGATLRAVVGLHIAGVTLALAAGLALVIVKARVRFAWSKPACAALLRFGWRSHLSSLTAYANQRADQLLLSLFVAPRELGLYVVAVAVASAAGFFPQAVGVVTMATGSNLAPAEARRMIARSFRLTFAGLSLACAAVFVLCPWLIELGFGRAFGPASTACKVLLPGTVALGLNQVLYDGARALEQPALPSWAEGLSIAVTAAGLVLLLPRFGFLGAAIASTAAYSASLVFMLHLARTRLQLGVRELLGILPAPALGHAT